MRKFIQKNPTHPGKLMWEFFIEPRNLTVTEMAKILNVSRPNLSNIINGRAGISALMALKLSRAFNTTPQFWINLQSTYDLAQAMKKKEAYQRIKAVG